MNLMMLLEMAAGAFGDRVAFQNGGDRLTYQELFDASGALATTLDDGRIRHLAMLAVTSLALPIALFGASWAGIPFAPLNYRLTDAELDSLIAQLHPGRLITDPDRVERLAGSGEQNGVEVGCREAMLEAVRAPHAPKPRESWSMDPEDTADLLYTSATPRAPTAM